MAVDDQEETLLDWAVTPGNQYDGHEFLPLVGKAVSVTWQQHRVFFADKGNDTGYIYVGMLEEFGSVPMIDIRRQRRRPMGSQLTLDPFLDGKSPRNSKQRRIGRPLTKEQQLRHHSPISRKNQQWRAYRKLILSLERLFSRLKGLFGLEQLWMGLWSGSEKGWRWGC